MSKKLMDETRKIINESQVPVACVGGQILIYKTGHGWVDDSGYYANKIMNKIGYAPQGIYQPLKYRFQVPVSQCDFTRYWYWDWTQEDGKFEGDWKPLMVSPNTVVFESGFINFKTGKQTPWDIVNKPIYGPVISTSFDPGARHDDWDCVIDNLFTDQAFHDYVQEALSLILLPHHFAKALMLMVGPSNTGKSTLAAAVATAPAGLSGQTSCNPDQAATRPFDCYPLVGKFVAISEELERLTGKGKTWLKAYTGGQFSWEVKYGDRSASAPTAKFIGITNKLPNFIEDSKAIHNRMVIIPMYREIKTAMNEDMCTANFWARPERRNAVISWLVAGLDRLIKKDFKLELPEQVDELKQRIRVETHPVLNWLHENLNFTGDPNDRVHCTELIQMMKNDKIIATNKRLNALMGEVYPDAKPNKRCRGSKGNWEPGRGFEGLEVLA